MIVSMEVGATEQQIKHVLSVVASYGYQSRVEPGEQRTVICVVGVGSAEKLSRAFQAVEVCDGVDHVVSITCSYKRVSREFKPSDSVVTVNGSVSIGGGQFAVIAGPCSVEGRGMLLQIAEAVKRDGANMLRGGAFKPRTSPYAFEGLGEEGLRLLAEAYGETGLPAVTEVMNPDDVALVCRHAHVLQIGCRNMQNNPLLDEVGRVKTPVLLKRHFAATIEEWLLAAERILKGGNPNVILCERGIRTCTEVTRFTLDVGAIVAAKQLSHLPIIADPSHPAGDRKYVPALARAAVAAGADGLIVEVHDNPERAKSDGKQSLTLSGFTRMMEQLQPEIALWKERYLLAHRTLALAG
ncbi:MAG: 3-deoxy-7-phosphoheptulonate synthase [Candidatus Doudnabacteria bacterium]|nr:3-deoxy-7-phosphoheptulonate synthase [Candidatus Doudnabacteria bacterium]